MAKVAGRRRAVPGTEGTLFHRQFITARWLARSVRREAAGQDAQRRRQVSVVQSTKFSPPSTPDTFFSFKKDDGIVSDFLLLPLGRLAERFLDGRRPHPQQSAAFRLRPDPVRAGPIRGTTAVTKEPSPLN